MDELYVKDHFNGPLLSANGGYACGLFADRAAELLGAVDLTVTLFAPPPLAVPLRADAAGRRAHVWDGDRLVAGVAIARPDIDTPAFVSPGAAARAEREYRGLSSHPFPSCFVCGTERGERESLAMRPGPLPGEPPGTACTWTPDPVLAGGDGRSVPVQIAWAALDCPGGWTADLSAGPMVLSRMTARLDRLPVTGECHVVVGRMDSRSDRTMVTTTAIYRAGGERLGHALSVWTDFLPGALGPGAPGCEGAPSV
ncbi:hypothetical protein ACFHYQ_03880 [Sphaerimonospora cavernae]|uniref:Thioesterase family protein n=1 Tax=Sphaerimonospora cavernae TaxID=1740611 RepID=A0ABV6U2T7_9ACTN